MMGGGAGNILYNVSVWLLPVLIAITFHEAAHGFIAWKLGDDTAYRLGRVSFNPLKHVDPFGTVILPAFLLLTGAPFLFGWAKPVPVAFHRLRNFRRDMVLVAAAGPGANLILATIASLLMHVLVLLPNTAAQWVFENLYHAIMINLVLAIFNMLPLPPLDGGRVAVGLLPAPLARPLAQLERYGLFIIIGILFLLPMVGNAIGIRLDIFHLVILRPLQWLMPLFLQLGGVTLGS